MRIPFIALAICTFKVSSQCIDLKTTCISEDGTPCRQIAQLTPEKGCGREVITLEGEWCNSSSKPKLISKDSTLILTGGAVASLNNGNPLVLPVSPSSLGPGECDGYVWSVTINNCKPFFNYEMNIKTNDKNCRGFEFRRQMKTICKTSGRVKCTLGDTSGPAATQCQDYEGPTFKIIQKEGCPDVKCVDQSAASCRKDITYEFDLRNFNGQKVKFDLFPPQIANSKVAWQIVDNNQEHFSDLGPGGSRAWSQRKTNVNICRVIPSASINIRGNVIDPKTNKKDENFQFCFSFENQNVRKFDQANGKKFPFCSEVIPIPTPAPPTPPTPPTPSKGNKGKGKGGKGPSPPSPPAYPSTCPGIRPPIATMNEL